MDIVTATAKVGRDTIENAEYLIFEWSNSKTKKTFKDKIGDFWFYVTTPFWKVKHWIKYAYLEVRYGFQRMFKGYDCVDTFETYIKFVDRYTKILTEYRKNHFGYVCGMTNEEWEAIIDEMIYHLHYMNELNVESELEKDVPENWNPSQRTIDDIMEKHKDEFFRLFSEYFFNLWD